MRTSRFGAMLLVAASLFALPATFASASDWLGGPYWGRISGCACCGEMMYGRFAPEPACYCSPMGWAPGAEGPSRPRIVPLCKSPIESMTASAPTPATKGKYERPRSKDGDCGCTQQSSCSDCNQCGDCCGRGCGCGLGGLCGGGKRGCGGLAGRRAMNDDGGFFNCGCNGSYKFPVPPLYTYHWPGMYSLQLMTDYHSPWRFPPLRPYSDEPEGDYFSQAPAPIVQPSSFEPSEIEVYPTQPGQVESMSQAMERFYR